MLELFQDVTAVVIVMAVVVVFGILFIISRWYRKAAQGQALVRTGFGGVKVSFNGIVVVPVIHKLEIMDISLKTIEISRMGKDGLICMDNLRADIKVAFFVRVNQEITDVKKVAQSVGCERASSKAALVQLFEAKFSEALKTVGKRIDFVDLYNKRDEFRKEIINVIGTDLNGYILDDCAIDYLEQTSIVELDPNNILDSEGIKKITELTAVQKIKSNKIKRDEEKTIKQQNVEAKEAILELEKQLAEQEEKQKREVENIRSREQAEIAKVAEEERLKSERARIATEEELMIAEENKNREIIVAAKNKERTDAVESERVEKDRLLEVNERERIVTLANIEREKSIEEEKKNIQEVIRERVAIEKTVVDEEEKIKDTRAFAEAEREKSVAVTNAEKLAEEQLVQQIKAAEAAKQAAEFQAKQKLIDAEADQASAAQRAEAIKVMAEAEAAKQAAVGLAEAQVMEAKAEAREKQGEAEASVLEDQALAEAKGIEAKALAQAQAEHKLGEAEAKVIAAKAEADQKKGLIEAEVAAEKFRVEAEGIDQKAEAMKKLDGVGKEHEEFKLRLDKEKQVELAQIHIQKDIADAQAEVISNALKSAKIDIVGGEAVFFDKITNAISNGRSFDRQISNSDVLTQLKDQLMDPNDGTVLEKMKDLISESKLGTEDVKNLSIAALLGKMMAATDDPNKKGFLEQILKIARSNGFDNKTPGEIGLN